MDILSMPCEKMLNRIKNKVTRMTTNCKTNAYLKKIIRKLNENNIHFVFVEPPYASKIKNLSDFEKQRIDTWVFDFNDTEKNMSMLKKIYGDDIDEEYIRKIYDGGIVVNDGGKKRVLDFSNEYVNIRNGMRHTAHCPEKYYGGIHVYGTCIVRGTGVQDDETIASFIQERINKNIENSYKVFNHGIGRGSRLKDDLECIEDTVFSRGDVVVVIDFVNDHTKNICEKNGGIYIETSNLFDRPNGKLAEWFTDEVVHTNSVGNNIIAEFIFEHIKQFLSVSNRGDYNPSIRIREEDKITNNQMNPELKKYIEMISKYKIDNPKYKIGSIVMNCNPFTNGHRYLIETASKMVDYLYIFVVEEDKSIFPFKDRIELVKKGTKDLENVIVLPSGKFIISSITFPGYFMKEQNKEMEIDASGDIELFGKFICPALNIKMRFAGEEPIDKVTRQYNRTMEEFLPLYGVEFIEIKRKTSDKEVISASRVRKCMDEGDLMQIKKLVPKTTYEYLEKKMSYEQK